MTETLARTKHHIKITLDIIAESLTHISSSYFYSATAYQPEAIDYCSALTSNMPALQSHGDWENRVMGIMRLASSAKIDRFQSHLRVLNLWSLTHCTLY